MQITDKKRFPVAAFFTPWQLNVRKARKVRYIHANEKSIFRRKLTFDYVKSRLRQLESM